eukprot:2747710-Prymnesium_polylepis.1
MTLSTSSCDVSPSGDTTGLAFLVLAEEWDGHSLTNLSYEGRSFQPALVALYEVPHPRVRFAQLYLPTNASSIDELEIVSLPPASDPFATVEVRTKVVISSTLETLTTNTTSNTIVAHYSDLNHSVLAGPPNSTVAHTLSTRPPIRTLRLLQPASGSLRVSMRENFTVTLSLLTETGLPVPGQPVTAHLLDYRGAYSHSNGSDANVSLMSGSTLAFTDQDGVATLT